MLDAKAAFDSARAYLTGDPIYANYVSVQPTIVVPTPDGRWFVACQYEKQNQQASQQKERATVIIGENGKVVGMFKF